MLSFDLGPHRFQIRAAAIFIHQRHVLLHRIETDDFWALPGGRVEFGETAEQTLVREMKEELGEDIRCAGLVHSVENFFEYSGQKNHEIGFYHRTEFAPGSRMLDVSRMHEGVEGDKRLIFRWVPLDDLAGEVLYPEFLRTSLAVPDLPFRHMVQYG